MKTFLYTLLAFATTWLVVEFFSFDRTVYQQFQTGIPEAYIAFRDQLINTTLDAVYVSAATFGFCFLRTCYRNIKVGYKLTPEAKATRAADRVQRQAERSRAWTRITYYLLGGGVLFFLVCVYIYLNK